MHFNESGITRKTREHSQGLHGREALQNRDWILRLEHFQTGVGFFSSVCTGEWSRYPGSSSSSLLLSSLELSDTKVCLNTSPPRNRCTFMYSSCPGYPGMAVPLSVQSEVVSEGEQHPVAKVRLSRTETNTVVQGYLAHKKHPPPRITIGP